MAKKTVKVKKHSDERILPKHLADKMRNAVDDRRLTKEAQERELRPDLIEIRAYDANGLATPLPGAVAVAVKVRGGTLRITTTPDGDAALLFVPE